MENKENLFKKNSIRLLDHSQIVVLFFLIAYLIFAMLQFPGPTGEAGSFTLATVSLIESGDFVITEEEYEQTIQLMPSHKSYLDWYFHDFMPKDDDGNRYPWYFGIYSILCIPIFVLLNLLHLDVTYSFAITNALLLSGALYVVYRACELSKGLRLLLVLFLGFSPVIRYIQWQSYEVATCSFVMVSMVFWFTGRRNLGALCLALAGTMNPTAMAFGIFMILEYFFERLQEDCWDVAKFVRRCVADWKEIGLYALCFVPCLVPVAITYWYFESFNMVAMTGITDYAGAPSRMLAYLFDLNLGLLPYVPLLLVLFVAVGLCAIYKGAWKYVFAVVGVVATIAAFSLTFHINCGMTGIARYNSWLMPMMLCTVVFAVQTKVFIPKLCSTAITALGLSVCWCLFTVGVVAYGDLKGHAFYWSPYAEKVMSVAPQWYNPLPSTFNCRTNHIDGGYTITEPVIYEGQDGYVRKVLVPTALGVDALDNLVVGEQDQAVFAKECEKLQTEKEFCYLNFPLGTTILNAQPYTLGTEIIFTPENNGTKYFRGGISSVEGNFAWSDGLQSKLRLNVGTVTDDIEAHFEFSVVYGGTQTLVVSSNGQELFYDAVTGENPNVSFMIPQECVINGVIDLTLEYPDAVDLMPVSNGTDGRIIALGWKQITFQSAGQESQKPDNEYTLGDKIVFTAQDNGTRYFQRGISAVETDFAWSDGHEGTMYVMVGEQAEDLTATVTLKAVYNGSQTMIVTCNGQELFRNQVTMDEGSVSFVVPSSCIVDGGLQLVFSYPDAVSPLELGESDDNRVLAVGYQAITIQPME